MNDHPWGLTEIHVSPSGLRECVLRAQYLNEAQARSEAERQKDSLFHVVVRWRVYRPLQWAELIRVMNIGAFELAARETRELAARETPEPAERERDKKVA